MNTAATDPTLEPLNAAMWTIPFPKRDSGKGRRKKQQQGGGTKRREGSQPAAAAAAAAARGNRRPAWDTTLTDHGRFKLTQAEQVGAGYLLQL